MAGKLRPRVLPKRDLAPIAFELGGRIFNSDGTTPPAMREIQVSLDRNIAVAAAGLPACGRSQLAASGVAAARQACRGSLIGSGVAHVAIESGGQARSTLPLSLFNGGVRDEKTTLLLHSSLTGLTPRPLVAPVKLERNQGRYGLEGLMKMPRVLGDRVALLDFDLEVKRFLKHEGTQRHFVLARCFDGRLQARLWFKFVDGTSSSPTLLQPCVASG